MIAKETGASMITRRRRGLGNFSTNLEKEKILILNMLDVNLVNLGGSSVPNCYICRKEGHYANQCRTKDKGKAPTINMVMPEIQQVTIRSKGKQSEWEVQEVVHKADKEWVEEANNNNATRMMHDNAIPNKEQLVPQSEPLPVHEQEEF